MLLTAGTIFACGGGDEFFVDFYNSFFAPEISKDEVSKPFFRSIHTYYGNHNFYKSSENLDSVNINEWSTYFQNRVTSEDLKYVIYESRMGELDTLIFYLKNNTFPIANYLKANSLLAYEDKLITKEFLFYQGFAKRCELYGNYVPNYWDDDDSSDPRKDTISMRKLLVGGQRAFLSAKSLTIKQRYAFQLVRLFFQAGFYDEAIAFHDANKGLFTTKNTIYYRTLGYVAASLYKLEEYSKANYLYSIIFDGCELMKETSFYSFHPQEESDWEGALALAQSTREKEVLWHILGIYVDPLRAMKEIYTINPKSNFLDLLLVRAVNINEELFLRRTDYYSEPDTSFAFLSENVNSDLRNFIQQVSKANNTNKPYLWNLSAGYLNLVSGNHKQAEAYFISVESSTANDTLVYEQIRAFRIISEIELLTEPNSKIENQLTQDLLWMKKEKHHSALRISSIYQWCLSRLSEKYYTYGESVKAQCLDNLQHREFYKNVNNLNEMIKFLDKPDKSSFEKYIVTIYPYSKVDMFKYKAIKNIYQYKFKDAIATLDSCAEAGRDVLPADPFVIHIKDCHDCDFGAWHNSLYTHYEFLKRIIELEEKAQIDKANASQYYFQIANGLYNITYFGNAHAMFSSPFINLSVGYSVYWWGGDANAIMNNRVYFDCSKAMEYYQKAIDASNDKEFKAKCCFMAAKCEQNQYFISPQFSYKHRVKSGTYYNQLYDSYSDTKYYNEVLNECGYFKTFVTQK